MCRLSFGGCQCICAPGALSGWEDQLSSLGPNRHHFPRVPMCQASSTASNAPQALVSLGEGVGAHVVFK